MAITLYHHPWTRAARVVWMLEEVEVPYTLRFVDGYKGEQKSPEILALNPMGKVPVLTDGDTVLTETAAIGLYLADRYALGKLAPLPDDPARGPYLRWSFFGPSVLEPAVMAKVTGWNANPGSAGWGTYEDTLRTLEHALEKGPYLLGDRFSMADVVLGSTMRFLLQFKILDPLPLFLDYVGRLEQRPALQRADAKNAAVANEHGIKD